jgi:hypothetical protein
MMAAPWERRGAMPLVFSWEAGRRLTRLGQISKSHMPPVPPAGRSPIGGSANAGSGNDMSQQVAEDNKASKNRNLGEQGRQGNVKQNRTHKGYQQDR